MAWRESAFRETVRWLSRLRARNDARALRGDGRLCRFAAELADRALRLVDAFALFGTGRCTPARRALDKPMAIACFVERAPCLPSRT